MEVTQVTVNIHEKRNHPHEYGHYDASVTLVADLVPEESLHLAIETLRTKARTHVQAELDGWLASIEEQRRIDRTIQQIESFLNRLHWHGEKLYHAKLVVQCIRELPEGTRGPWKERLRQRLAEVKAEEEKRRAAQDREARACPDCGQAMMPDGLCPHCDDPYYDDHPGNDDPVF